MDFAHGGGCWGRKAHRWGDAGMVNTPGMRYASNN